LSFFSAFSVVTYQRYPVRDLASFPT
jgi:hypothetical protein